MVQEPKEHEYYEGELFSSFDEIESRLKKYSELHKQLLTKGRNETFLCEITWRS